MTNQTKNSMLLMLCALIWGTAFVAQSAGSGMGAFSFLAGRSWMAVLVPVKECSSIMMSRALSRSRMAFSRARTSSSTFWGS